MPTGCTPGGPWSRSTPRSPAERGAPDGLPAAAPRVGRPVGLGDRGLEAPVHAGVGGQQVALVTELQMPAGAHLGDPPAATAKTHAYVGLTVLVEGDHVS